MEEYYFYDEPVHFAIIKNFYKKDDINDISEELEKILPHLSGPGETGSARGVTGTARKDNQGIFLDNFYNGRREQSAILTLNRKIFTPEVKHELKKGSWFFNYMNDTVEDTTLVSYYHEGDYYKTHEDQAFITAIYYIWDEPKGFEGGDLYFGDFKVPIENNCMLIFPSKTEHRVEKITRGGGRWALSQFVSMTRSRPKPIEIDRYKNFLNVSDFNKIQLHNSSSWKLGGYSNENGKKFWYLDLTPDPFYANHLKSKIEEVVGAKLVLLRVYANGQTFGQDGEFHQDATEPNHLTFLLYTNAIDDLDSWGGETQFRIRDFLRSYQPETNSAIFFNSNLWHRGLGPSRNAGDAMRITVAWKFKIC
jgi:predicted 2-oxoglutarate/Fe(II)-dependent dioxygenase YbiX